MPRETQKRFLKPSESRIQSAFVAWCHHHEHVYPELGFLFAIPNGGLRNVNTARKLKREGTRRGVPDLCLPAQRGNYAALWIEIKTWDGRLSKDQRRWHDYLLAQGYYVETCYELQDAIELVKWYLALT